MIVCGRRYSVESSRKYFVRLIIFVVGLAYENILSPKMFQIMVCPARSIALPSVPFGRLYYDNTKNALYENLLERIFQYPNALIR